MNENQIHCVLRLRFKLYFRKIEIKVVLWSLTLVSTLRVLASITSMLFVVRIGSISVRVVFVILVGSEILLVRLLMDKMSRISCVFGIFKKSTLTSPTMMILSDISLTLSKDHERLFQNVEFV